MTAFQQKLISHVKEIVKNIYENILVFKVKQTITLKWLNDSLSIAIIFSYGIKFNSFQQRYLLVYFVNVCSAN